MSLYAYMIECSVREMNEQVNRAPPVLPGVLPVEFPPQPEEMNTGLNGDSPIPFPNQLNFEGEPHS